jgi:hypothetical protein
LYSGTLKGAAIQTFGVPSTAAIRCNCHLLIFPITHYQLPITHYQ